MLTRTLAISAILALGLAACDEDQVAQNPDTPTETGSETAMAPETDMAAEEDTRVTVVEPTADETATAPDTAAEDSETDVTGATADEARTTSENGNSDQASASNSIAPYVGQRYTAGLISLQLNEDNTFVMNQVEGNQSVEGQYAYENGTLTFSEPQGDIQGANFPIRCRFEPATGEGFQLEDAETSCGPLAGLSFERAAA